MALLTTAHRTAGRTAGAIALHEQNLADQERVLGSDHPDTLTTRGNLAAAYRAAGRTAEAVVPDPQTVNGLPRCYGNGRA
jgi:hypothetical protein